jgi:hypothetical protein
MIRKEVKGGVSHEKRIQWKAGCVNKSSDRTGSNYVNGHFAAGGNIGTDKGSRQRWLYEDLYGVFDLW